MNRAALLFAVVVATALFAVSRDIQPAFACTGPPPWQQMAYADAIFEGRVTQARHLPEQDQFSYRVFEVVLRVEVPHLNSVAGQEFVTHTRVPKPDVPQMCPQFDASEEFVGRYLVASVHERGLPELILDRWSTPFIGDEPAGPEYELANRIARLAARTDPGAPLLEVEPANPRCGELVAIVGYRFPPNADVDLTYPGMPGEVSTPLVVHTDATGLLGAKVLPGSSACGYKLGFVEAWDASGTPYGDGGIPLAIFPLAISEDPVPGPPVAGTGLAIIAQDRDLPWNDVVMVTILLLAFSGGTIAILRSVRRR